MRAFAHDVYTYPLPPGHRFPLAKYRLVREGAEAAGLDIRPTRAASATELGLAHSEEWIERVETGGLERREELALGLPWSPELVERARRSVGATLLAAETALADADALALALPSPPSLAETPHPEHGARRAQRSPLHVLAALQLLRVGCVSRSARQRRRQRRPRLQSPLRPTAPDAGT